MGKQVRAWPGRGQGCGQVMGLMLHSLSLQACTRFTYDLAEEARTHALGPATPGFHLMSRLRYVTSV